MNPDTGDKGNIWRAVLSVVLGAGAAIVTFFLLIFLFIALGLFGWSDGGDPESLRRLETTTNITSIISIVAAIVVFIIIVIKVNQKRLKR